MPLTQVQGGMLAGSTNTTTTIQSNGTTAITIDSSQNVGVGSASSGNKFEVAGSGMFSGAVTTNTTGTHISYQSSNSQIGAWGPDTSTNGTLVFYSARSNGSNGLERMRIDSGGKLYLNTTSGTNAVTALRNASAASGKFWQSGPDGNNNYIIYNQNGNGVYLLDGNTSWQGLSDENVKENLVPIENAVEKVNSLRAVIGNYIADENKTKHPFLIAQDVEKVLPEAVGESPEGHLGLSYTDVIPLLVASIKELNAKVEAQAAEIAALKAAP